MTRGLMSLRDTLVDSVRRVLISAPWHMSIFIFRRLYGFHVEGAENIPPEGPFILALNEYSPVAMLVSGWISIVLLERMLEQKPGSTMSYLQEELFAFEYFREALGDTHAERTEGGYAALTPHGAGRLTLSLLDGYRVLRDGGLVIINPEGDAPWDGRPLPLGNALAWLGLYTAAPILPALCSVGAYDIWPRWRTLPSLRGKLVLSIGQPFTLCDTPRERVTDEDIEKANARIQAEFDLVRYGPGGISEWAGPPLRDSVPLEQPIQLPLAAEPVSVEPTAGDGQVPLLKRGIALLLWRCPVCHTHDALIHARPRFRPQTVSCQACDTRWEVRHVPGKDFRLKIVAGAPDLVGLDRALSTWYDEMKRDFQPSPIPVPDVDLLPGEEVYLEVSGASLSPYRPNALFDGWTGREPPQALLPGRRQLANWESIGEGRLWLTSHRLLWQGPQGELDFMWSSMKDVSVWILNTLGIRYGTAPYRFSLGQEVGLKWLTYAGTLALQAAEHDGHKVTTSPF
jgi:1-acyl-sn-glycerol-3-phosphate acyltransferase